MNKNLFDDFNKMMMGAFSTADAARHEGENFMKQRMNEFFGNCNLVTKEEFEQVRTMAANARAENEALKARVEALEGQLKENKK